MSSFDFDELAVALRYQFPSSPSFSLKLDVSTIPGGYEMTYFCIAESDYFLLSCLPVPFFLPTVMPFWRVVQ